MAEANKATSARRGLTIASSAEVLQQINIENAKFVAILLLSGMLIFHGVLKITTAGSDTCQWLLTQGRYQGENIWQPFGCMLHKYSQIDAAKCLRQTGYLTGESNHFVFVGDSRIRQLYFEVLKNVDPDAQPYILESADAADSYFNSQNAEKQVPSEEDISSRPLEKAHRHLSYNNTLLSLRMSFFWVPVFNQSAVDLVHQLAKSSSHGVPSLFVAGSGIWEMKLSNGSEEEFVVYTQNLINIVRATNSWPKNRTRFLWKLQEDVEVEKLSESRRMITNELIDSYNEIALEVLGQSRFRIWNSARQVTERMALGDDGLHLSRIPLRHQAQIVLNMQCNEWMDFDDGTCCRSAEATTPLQIITFALLLTCFLTTVAGFFYRNIRSWRNSKSERFHPAPQKYDSIEKGVVNDAGDKEKGSDVESSQPHIINGHVPNGKLKVSDGDNIVIVTDKSRPSNATTAGSNAANVAAPHSWQVAVTALGKLGLIMAYFYLCDRTTFFMKENKYYTHLNFWLPIGYVFAVGLFFHEESRSTRVLHRDQTDEWKGWMQLVILIYHFTGASQVIPLYMQMRVLVSSYLFLTGYGHLSFFWNGGSASFSRLFQVVFRMNLMTVVICLCMNRPYQSYYFVPLVTFWYLVVYAVLALPPKVSSTICDTKPIAYFYIILKFVGLFSAITILYLSEVFFSTIFSMRPWKALFVTQDDEIHEWWFRWSLDRYSICFGMVFGFLYLNGQKFGLIDDNNRLNLFHGRILALTVVAALLGIGGYTAFTVTCPSKPYCNSVHSYLAFVPIVSFIFLRNVFGPIRVRYSSFFAWFGRISLELFIGQYHIWLAADTHGVLVLIPNYPILNVLATTFVLVCVAHEVHVITGQLVALAVPSDWKRALRNVILFFLALVPIAIHAGML